MNFEQIQNAALLLPQAERATLAQKLLLSLETLPEDEIQQTWLQEALRRARQIDAGEVRLIPAEDVMHKAQALLK